MSNTSVQSVAVGIDLGTTHSVVAYLDRTGRPVTIPNLEGDATTPSVVYFEESSVVVGKEAVKVAEYEPDLVAQYAKRDLGKPGFQKAVGGREYPPEVLQALVLQKLKADADHRLGDVRKCVVTVPAYFNEPRRKATQDAGRLAGLDIIDIINEPTAAALAFGIQDGFVNPEGRTDQLESVLVYDLGGGTFDVTMMEIEGNNYRAIATAGDVYLGGIDWDKRIADHVAEQFQIQHGIDPRADPSDRQRLLSEAEDAKKALSQRENVVIRFAAEGQRIQVPLDRSEFEDLCGDLIDRTMFTTRRVLQDADRKWTDVSRLLLVGGSSRMPMVHNMLEQETGLKVNRSLSADESVAHGAAIYAGILMNSDQENANRISVSNVNSHNLGILGLDSKTGFPKRGIMIPRNTSLPTKASRRFSTSRPNQGNIVINVVEGGDEQGRHSTPVGRCVVRDLPPDLPKATPVQVVFHYKQDGRLEIVAHLPSVNRKASLVIERGSGLRNEEIAYWQKRIQSDLMASTDEPAVAATGEFKHTAVAEVPNVTAAAPQAEKARYDTPNPFTEISSPADEPADQPPATEAKESSPAKMGGWKSRRQRVQRGDE